MTVSQRRVRTIAVATAALLALSGCQTLKLAGMDGKSDIRSYTSDERDRELRLAAAARASGQFDAALGIYRNLLLAEPGRGDAQIALAETMFEKGERDRALAAFNKALEDNSPDPMERAQALTGRGRTLLALARPASAERDFLDALNLEPGNAVALNGRAVAADMQGRHRDAQYLYRKALEIDPGNERVRSNLGLSFALAARFDEAVAELAPLTRTSDLAPKARHNLALTLGLMGRDEQAVQLTSADLDQAQSNGNRQFYRAIRDAVTAEADATSSPEAPTAPPTSPPAAPPVAAAPAPTPAAEPRKYAAHEPASAPAPTAMTEPSAKAAAKPIAEAKAEPAPKMDAKAEPAPKTAAADVEPAPETMPETLTEAVREAQVEAPADPAAEAKSEDMAEPAPMKAEPAPEPDADEKQKTAELTPPPTEIQPQSDAETPHEAATLEPALPSDAELESASTKTASAPPVSDDAPEIVLAKAEQEPAPAPAPEAVNPDLPQNTIAAINEARGLSLSSIMDRDLDLPAQTAKPHARSPLVIPPQLKMAAASNSATASTPKTVKATALPRPTQRQPAAAQDATSTQAETAALAPASVAQASSNDGARKAQAAPAATPVAEAF